MHNIVKTYGYKFAGIINGIDVKYFSPSNAEDITKTYTVTKAKEGKKENKLALQKKLGLPEDENVPLVAMITRLTAGKGIDLVLHIIEGLLCGNIQLVILGTGETEYENKLIEVEKKDLILPKEVKKNMEKKAEAVENKTDEAESQE